MAAAPERVGGDLVDVPANEDIAPASVTAPTAAGLSSFPR
jgi:hypothetical protein